MAFALPALFAVLIAGAPYVDTKGRFELELPTGWRLLPAYGDTFGMRFQRALAGGRVSLTVHADPVESDSLDSFVSQLEGWVLEQGLERRARSKGRVGSNSAIVIDFDSGRQKDDRSATKARSYFFEDRGQRFHLHVSASPRFVYDRAERELRVLLASFTTRAPRSSPEPVRTGQPPASLVGRWLNQKGLLFQLDAEGHFAMGSARGRYLHEGETLSLMIEGKAPQTFRVELRDAELVLHSERLPQPAVYRRSVEKSPEAAASPLTGRWRAAIPGGTLELLLERSGRFTLESHRGRWVHDAGLLSLTTDQGEVIAYAVEIEGEKLSLSGGDLEEALWLQKISAE